MWIPRLNRRSSTFLRLSGYSMYGSTQFTPIGHEVSYVSTIVEAGPGAPRRITSGELLKYRSGPEGRLGRGIHRPTQGSLLASAFGLRMPQMPQQGATLVNER